MFYGMIDNIKPSVHKDTILKRKGCIKVKIKGLLVVICGRKRKNVRKTKRLSSFEPVVNG